MRTRLFILSFVVGCFCVNSQTVSHVYKIDGLLKRISDPDTTYVVNFWATWCKPCIQELPAFDSLHTSTKHTKRKVLLVSLDFSEELNKKVNPFLKKNNIRCECVLLDEVNGNDFINQISANWSGAIPATLIKYNTEKKFLERKTVLKELEDEIGKLTGSK